MTLPATAEGRSMYARMAWFAEQVGAPKVMDQPAIDWTLMSQSFDDVLRAHPDDWNAQQFVLMACSKPDLAAVQRMAAFVKEAPSEALLRRNLPMFQQCLDLAQGQGGPLLVMDPATGRLREVR